MKNNVIIPLTKDFSSTATTIELPEGTGQVLEDYLGKITYELKDINGVVISREILNITSRDGDILTVERAVEKCPVSDFVFTQTQEAQELKKGGVLSVRITAEDFDGKANLSGGNTFSGLQQFTEDILVKNIDNEGIKIHPWGSGGNSINIDAINDGGNFYFGRDKISNKWVFQSGKIGIVRETPLYDLDIDGSFRVTPGDNGTTIRTGPDNGNADVVLIRVDGNNKGKTDLGDYGFSIKYMGSRTGNSNALSIFSDNQNSDTQIEAFTLLQNGYLGLGTISPTAKFDVRGSGKIFNAITSDSGTEALIAIFQNLENNRGVRIGLGEGGGITMNFGYNGDTNKFFIGKEGGNHYFEIERDNGYVQIYNKLYLYGLGTSANGNEVWKDSDGFLRIG